MRSRLAASTFALLLVLTACGGGEGGSDSTEGVQDTTTTAEQNRNATSTTDMVETSTTVGGEMDGVHSADTDLGEIVVDPEGFTLYVFTNDSNGESTCYDACVGLWPAVPGATAIGSDLDSSIFGTTMRNDGGEQLTVNGMPLYRYAPDTEPGDTTGQGFNDVWFAVDSAGNMIDDTSSDGTSTGYGYDY